MESETYNDKPSKKLALRPNQLKIFFLAQLNQAYYTKIDLLKHFAEIYTIAGFINLKHAINEIIDDLEKQMSRLNEISILLDEKTALEIPLKIIFQKNNQYIGISQPENDSDLSDLSILFYLKNVESMELISCKFLKIASAHLKNKHIKHLLRVNQDEVLANVELLSIITSQYFKN